MERVKGLVIKLPKSRIKLLNDLYFDDLIFSEPVPWFTHGNKTPLLCFVFDSDYMTHISLGNAGKMAGTNLRRVNLYHVVKLNHPISIDKIIEGVKRTTKNYLCETLKEGGILTKASIKHIIQILLEIDSDTYQLLFRFTESFEALLNKFSTQVKMNLALQKEALLTAFLLAGQDFDKTIIQQWVPSQKPSCFLDGLEVQRSEESQVIMNDFQKFPGFSALSGNFKGTAIFLSPSEKMTVIYADKLPLEQLTGADLIYYNETYNSFVFVQYKMLDGKYYRPDKNLYTEISRMEELIAGWDQAVPSSCADFRLRSNPFFLKLCPRVDLAPECLSLSQGMYLPLEYWKILDSSKQIVGPHGGKRVSFDNVGRYLSNTEFAVLVAKGWVGSDPKLSIHLGELIKLTISGGRTVVYAVKQRRT